MTAQANETPAVEATKSADDVFTAAFDMLAERHDKPDPVSLTEPEPTETSTEAAVTADPAAQAAEPDQTEFVDPDATQVQAEVKPEAKPEAKPEPAQPVLGDDFADKLARALAAQQQPVQQQPVQQPAAPPPLFTADETAFLTEYEKDYPDVARAEALRRRAENRLVVQHVFNEIAQVVEPLQRTIAALLSDQQLAQLQQVVPEYETKREDVIKWVDTQPSYLKIAYNHVIQNGTVEEVADLIGRYNQATGAQSQQQRASAAATQTTELPAATKKAAAALAPVGSKRTTVVRGIAKDDFDGAFAEAASQS